jgi:hypothetical protein
LIQVLEQPVDLLIDAIREETDSNEGPGEMVFEPIYIAICIGEREIQRKKPGSQYIYVIHFIPSLIHTVQAKITLPDEHVN